MIALMATCHLVDSWLMLPRSAVLCLPRRRGPLYYVIVLMAVTSLYWRGSPVGLIIASLMCGGDGELRTGEPFTVSGGPALWAGAGSVGQGQSAVFPLASALCLPQH